VNARRGALIYRSRSPILGRLRLVDTMAAASTQVLARDLSSTGPGVAGRLNERLRRAALVMVDGEAGRASVHLRHAFVDASGVARVLRARLTARVPRSARLVVDYAGWTSRHPRRLHAYVLAHGERTPVEVAGVGDASRP
jgi:hypothetical protein